MVDAQGLRSEFLAGFGAPRCGRLPPAMLKVRIEPAKKSGSIKRYLL
jgi:hypothetical protein